MEHWHGADCLVPEVILIDGPGIASFPRCKNCGASAAELLKCLKFDAKDTTSLTFIPPNEPPRKLNISWPPSIVPYLRSSCGDVGVADSGWAQLSPSTELDPLSECKAWPIEDTPDPQKCIHRHATGTVSLRTEESKIDPDPAPPPPSRIYPKQLTGTEIRLICLQTMPGELKADHPLVHCTLEVYGQENCPEYEALSYTWGGEDGDACRTRPIYIGEYWDVLLQTENCFAMLHRLVPKRGFRLLWVDAICINQDDRLERESQVANMMKIYSNCSRVIVFPGADIVRHPSDKEFPSRYDLDDFDTVMESEGVTLSQILRRRYFSRIWVIQELILPRQVVFLVGDKEFFAQGLSSARLERKGELNWTEGPAPWLRYLGNQSLPGESQNLLDALLLTRRSESSDFRDKVFGILGLLHDEKLHPNYGASGLMIFLGSLLHQLLIRGDIDILYFSRGLTGCTDCLSWLPLWESTTDIPSRPGRRLVSYSESESAVTDRRLLDYMTPKSRLDLVTSNTAKTTGSFSGNHASPFADMSSRPAMTVDPDSGYITAEMIRLFKFTTRPILAPQTDSEGRSLYRIGFIYDNYAASFLRLEFTSFPAIALNQLIKPGFDHFFLMRRPQWERGALSEKMTGLILRYSEFHINRLPRRVWRIVARCPTVAFDIGQNVSSYLSHPEKWLDGLQRTRYRRLRNRPLFCDLARNHDGPLHKMELKLFTSCKPPPQPSQLIPLAAVIVEQKGKVFDDKLLIDAYVKTLDPALEPRREGDTIYLTFNGTISEVNSFLDATCESLDFSWYCRHEDESIWVAASDWKYGRKRRFIPGGFFHNAPVRVRLMASLLGIAKAIKASELSSHIKHLWGNMGKVTRDDIFRLLQNKPNEELDGAVLAPAWPQEIVEMFKIDGATYRITIA